MEIFKELLSLKSENLLRFCIISIGFLVILGLLIWVSIIDIKKKSITFYKMLIASSSTIIIPFIASFFCGCPILKWFILGSLLLWVLFLFINIKFNKDKFIGKADIDLLSALFAECLMCSFWMYCVLDHTFVWIKILNLWYGAVFYFIIGSLAYLVLFLLYFFVKSVILKRDSFLRLLKGTKISVIPMLIPISVMVPLTIMLM